MEHDQPRIRIAVDAMGGDYAPKNVVAGAVDAIRQRGNNLSILLVGVESAIRSELQTSGAGTLPFEIVNTSQVIDMHDGATAALKQKKDSSITVGITLQKERHADAFVSAGHTGAVMSASTLILGRIEGVSRPTIGAFLPTENGVCLLVDAGANVDCRPQHLLEFGIMGSIYSREMLKIGKPTVGLLNIGEESSKGNDVSIETYQLLSKSNLNFIGNIEGRDILKGKAHVVVCDGFVGNVVLKFAESLLDFMKAKFRRHASQNLLKKIWIGMMYGTLRKILRDFDYQEYGGVPLLGVNGVSIIGHGNSTPKAIQYMILNAEDIVRRKINQRIQEALLTSR
jgi:phosphate acyltransferase